MMRTVIKSVTSGVPAALVEIRRLGRTLKQRPTDVLAFFDQPGSSNGPTEAINGRLEHLAARPSASETSTTTSPEACSNQAASDPIYTPIYDEPVMDRDGPDRLK
jgi:hypothetical protein